MLWPLQLMIGKPCPEVSSCCLKPETAWIVHVVHVSTDMPGGTWYKDHKVKASVMFYDVQTLYLHYMYMHQFCGWYYSVHAVKGTKMF